MVSHPPHLSAPLPSGHVRTRRRSALAVCVATLLLSTSSLPAAELTPEQSRWYVAQLGGAGGGAGWNQSVASPIGDAVLEWNRLQQTEINDFGRLARFMLANPGFPGEDRLRRLAERADTLVGVDSGMAIAFFTRFPPMTAGGHVRHAVALDAAGRRDAAIVAARAGWVGGALTDVEEARVLALLPGALSMADHDARMERLLPAGAIRAAERVLPLTSPERRSIYAARLAMRAGQPDAAAQAAGVEAAYPGIARRDAGYLADKATWLRASGNSMGARQLLAADRQLAAPPVNVEDWLKTLLVNARAAQTDRQHHLAYDIARRLGDALPAGTVVRDQSLDVRDDYTSLAWLAGNTALRQLNRAGDAARLFRQYADAARSPQTRTKGLYWAARASLLAGNRDRATALFTEAAAHNDQFYGQLSRERLGLSQPRPVPHADAAVTPAQRDAWNDSRIVRATRALGDMGLRREQTLFLRAIANNAKSDADHYLAGRFAGEIGRPDLGVMIGRSARINGIDDYDPAAFPSVPAPAGHGHNWTFIQAITRQESQFDRAAISHAGARGLMQLMPATARETAGKLGLGYDLSMLINDPAYNVVLGSTYFQQMLRYYNGSYPLAVAAYNAGPGNVNRWLRANGDPRTGGVDVIDWIEAIPIFETRNYVQRVLENAVVYDTIHPDTARRMPQHPLSFYLGKSTPG